MTAGPSGRRLVLLRHGRTAWNHEGRVQGQQDVELDDVGHQQAKMAAEHLAALGPTLLWSSDLARTRQTTAPLVEATGLEATYDPRLREFFFGARETLTHAEFAELDPPGFAALRRGDYDQIATAEPTAAVRERMSAVLHELLDALEPGATAVAVSHGAAIRVATGALLGWPDELFHTLQGIDNCATVVLEQPADVPGLRMRAYNRTTTSA